MNKVIVTESYTATYSVVIDGRAGEILQVGPEDVDFPGWLWCTDQTGTSSWVPKVYLEVEGERGRLLRDYNAMELTAEVGERLAVVEEESGWVLCETESGRRGWIPTENVRAL